MTLIKTSLLNAIAVVIKMLTTLGINKILAVYVGPTGYAALGQFQNAVQMITTTQARLGLVSTYWLISPCQERRVSCDTRAKP